MAFVTDGVLTALPKPDGYVVDFDNPQVNMELPNLIMSGVGMAICSMFLAQRLYVKIVVHRSVGIEDYCVATSWLFVIAMQALVINGYKEGIYGRHGWEMPVQKFARCVLFANYIQAIVYTFPSMLSKVTLLIFYLRLQNRERWFQITTWTTMAVTVGSNMGILFSIVFACKPIAMAYDISITDGICIDRAAVFKATAAFGVITDVLIFLIPIRMLIKLKLSRRKKLGLLFMFAIGSATVITSVVRLVLLIQNLSAGDLSWIGGPIFFWIIIEANLLVICACLPTLKHFVQAVAPNALGAYSSQKTPHHNPGSDYPYANNSSSKPNHLKYSSRAKPQSGTALSSMDRPHPRRDNYNGFDNEREYRMDVLVEGGGKRTRDRSRHDRRVSRDDEIGVASTRDASSGSRSSSALGRGGSGSDGRGDDADSAKAIMHTRAVEIHYEDRSTC